MGGENITDQEGKINPYPEYLINEEVGDCWPRRVFGVFLSQCGKLPRLSACNSFRFPDTKTKVVNYFTDG